MDKLSKKERIILQILNDNDKEMYGLEIVLASNNYIRRGSVYVHLQGLEEKDYVKSRDGETMIEETGHPRQLYSINNDGRRALLHIEVPSQLTEVIEGI